MSRWSDVLGTSLGKEIALIGLAKSLESFQLSLYRGRGPLIMPRILRHFCHEAYQRLTGQCKSLKRVHASGKKEDFLDVVGTYESLREVLQSFLVERTEQGNE
ncbi:hypothetical protein Tco_0712836 [Tanacetum coccineum]